MESARSSNELAAKNLNQHLGNKSFNQYTWPWVAFTFPCADSHANRLWQNQSDVVPCSVYLLKIEWPHTKYILYGSMACGEERQLLAGAELCITGQWASHLSQMNTDPSAYVLVILNRQSSLCGLLWGGNVYWIYHLLLLETTLTRTVRVWAMKSKDAR